MLPGVLLHMVEPPRPIDASHHGFPNFHGGFHIVENHAAFFMNVRHGNAVQRAVVRRLTAALRVKGRAVQRHDIAVFARLAVQHRCGKFRQKGVLVE